MLKSKKIVHISPVFQKRNQYNFEGLVNGGGGRYVSELALSMSKYQDTTLITFGESDYQYKYKALKIKIVKCGPFLQKFNGDADFICFRLFSILREYDIIHTYQYYSDTTLFACIFGLITRKKIFVTDLGFRGINISRYIQMKYFCNKVLILSLYEKNILGLKHNKFDVIGGGVDLNRYAFSTNKRKEVMFIGRLLPHKGVNYLIDALDPDMQCTIAGSICDESYFNFLKKIAKGKKVKFILSARDKKIIMNLKRSFVLVLPSVDVDIYGKKHRNSELFGLVIAESFACGTPVIVSDSAALPYIVDDSVSGFVVSQNNPIAIREKINFFLENPKQVLEMGKNGREIVEKKYNWDLISKNCLEIYEKSN